ncbi:MAG: ribulose-phosphate 3-epimerase [Thermaerobacter sp.]|nr:ribulose-phosphate 3-epimerase [Thermaerobacter sp.]
MKIAPSILAADFAALGAAARAAAAAGADYLHVDVMDGHFVPNLTLGPAAVKALRRSVELPLDVHLMVEDPDRFLEDFVRAGADILTVHAEAGYHLHRTLQRIRALGARAGVALNPATPLAAVEAVLSQVDLLLIMTVNPGFGGQKFLPFVLEKLAATRELVDRRELAVELEVDGGIDPTTAAEAVAAGAQVLVAGTAVFGAPDVAAAVSALRGAVAD